MGKLSDLVRRDFEEEIEIIKKTGSLWEKYLIVGSCLLAFWGASVLDGSFPWGPKVTILAMLAFMSVPFALRARDRSKVADNIRRHREICIDTKLNALLGLVSIKDGEDEG